MPIVWTRLEYCLCNLQQSSPAAAAVILVIGHLRQDCKVRLQRLNSLTSCLTLHCISAYCWRTRLKTEEHDVSTDFQRFLGSAAIEVGVFNDLVFDLGRLCCSCFMCYCYAVFLLASFQSNWPHYEVDQITNVEKWANSAGIPEVQ